MELVIIGGVASDDDLHGQRPAPSRSPGSLTAS